SLRNIVRDPRVALLFLIPGSGSTLRINGRAHVSADPELLASFTMEGKAPRTVIVMTVEEVYFQCARAIVRSDLWNPDKRVDPKSLPPPGQILAEMSDNTVAGKDEAERRVHRLDPARDRHVDLMPPEQRHYNGVRRVLGRSGQTYQRAALQLSHRHGRRARQLRTGRHGQHQLLLSDRGDLNLAVANGGHAQRDGDAVIQQPCLPRRCAQFDELQIDLR